MDSPSQIKDVRAKVGTKFSMWWSDYGPRRDDNRVVSATFPGKNETYQQEEREDFTKDEEDKDDRPAAVGLFPLPFWSLLPFDFGRTTRRPFNPNLNGALFFPAGTSQPSQAFATTERPASKLHCSQAISFRSALL